MTDHTHLPATGWLLLGLLLGLGSPASHAVSFDCDLATKPVEKMICDSPELSSLDEEIANAYVELRDSLSEAEQDALREEQQGWLGKRDACEGVSCVADLSTARLAELKGRPRPRAADAAVDQPVAEESPLVPGQVAADAVVAGEVPTAESSGEQSSPYFSLLLIGLSVALLLALLFYLWERRKANLDEGGSEEVPLEPCAANSASSADVRKPFCTQCGTKLAPTATFCTGCGAKRG